MRKQTHLRPQLLLAFPLALSVSLACEQSPNVDAEVTPTSLENRSPIIGGSPAGTSQFFSTVALATPQGQQFCTGTLIAPRVILTAAHCIDGTPASQVRVIAGTLRTAQVSGPQFYAAVTATAHPSYNQFFSNGNDPQGLGNNADIGVVVVNRDITQVPSAPLLTTAQIDANLQNGSPTIITGYGVTQVNGFNNGTLFIAETPYVRRSASEFIAGGSGFPDTCQGDSGGPVYALINGQAFVLGATSRGIAGTNIQCGAGGIYSLASAFVTFLEQASGGQFSFTAQNLEGGNPNPNPNTGEGTCGMCDVSSDCQGASAICLRYPEGAGFCSQSCNNQNDCASNFQCNVEQGFCVPNIQNQCVQGNVARVDACGTTVAQEENCTAGCANGSCTQALEGETCQNASFINAETQIIDGSLNGFENDSVGSCAGNGPERAYTFTLSEAKLFKAESSGFDTVLYLQRGCGTELLCNDDKAEQDRGSVIEGFLEPGEYTLTVDAFDNSVGNFRVRIDLSDAGASGDSCENRCGTQAPSQCWCDDQCARFGDCCADIAQQCQ